MPSYPDILANVAASMPSIQRLVSGAAYLIGLAFAFKAIHALKASAESGKMGAGGGSGKEPFIYLCIAAILIYFPSGLSIMLTTTFGTDDLGPISDLPDISGFNPDVLIALRVIIQTIGLISFVRGWVLVAKSASTGQPPGGIGKGLMHVAGGILAINIVDTIQILRNTLYGPS